MSINDPQWGNSHRPEQKEPEQVPEVTGTEPVQPEDGGVKTEQPKTPASLPPSSPKSPPPEGPPDLEQLWQQLVYQTRCKLARIFGKEPPPAPRFPSEPVLPPVTPSAAETLAGWQALSFKSWLIGVSLILGAWLVSGFYLVDAQQRGILSRFGNIISVEEAGWHWRWPYPIDSVRLINVTADRTLEVGLAAQKGNRPAPGLMLTSDGNLVGVSYAIVYQVTDPVAYLTQADAPVDLLALLAESTVRDVVGGQTLATMLVAGGAAKSAISEAVLQNAREHLQVSLEALQLGMIVKRLEIREAQLPAPVLQAVKEAERQEQAGIKTLRETQAAATDNLIKAHQLATKLQDESTDYTRAVEASAQAVRNAGVSPETTQAEQALADQALAWRQQYPLVFMSPADLQARVQPKGAIRPAAPSASGKATAPTSSDTVDEWRDRDLMRSRDRVDRPGSGGGGS